jgi:hypothetical protein
MKLYQLWVQEDKKIIGWIHVGRRYRVMTYDSDIWFGF